MNKRTIVAIMAIIITGCNTSNTDRSTESNTISDKQTSGAIQNEQPKNVAGAVRCDENERLLYSNETIASYTENKMRGKGVISIQLDINDRLDISYEDDAKYGEIVLNEDLTYYTLSMPKKIVARNVVPEYDVAAFDFDAEDVNADKDYLLIYINGEKRKVDKSTVKYTFRTHKDYIINQAIQLKPCNLLQPMPAKGKDMIYRAISVKGDSLYIKSFEGCPVEGSVDNIDGWVRWRRSDTLMVDLTTCE